MTDFKMGIIIDPIQSLNPFKDSSIALMREALSRGWQVFLFEMNALSIQSNQLMGTGLALLEIQTALLEPSGSANATSKTLSQSAQWYKTEPVKCDLGNLNLVLMRKDPPYTMAYHFATQLLSLLPARGTLVSNNPMALREHNEKLFALSFPDCIAPTVISSKLGDIQEFSRAQGEIVIKPLDAMGGQGIFKIDEKRTNLPVAVEMLTEGGTVPIMAQQYLPDITAGDKRILMIEGEPIPFVLARLPQGEDIRGNLAAGGKGVVQALSDTDRAICETVAPLLKDKGVHFAGLDVIGDRLTEINITSPTCIREIERETNIDIAGQLLTALKKAAKEHQAT